MKVIIAVPPVPDLIDRRYIMGEEEDSILEVVQKLIEHSGITSFRVFADFTLWAGKTAEYIAAELPQEVYPEALIVLGDSEGRQEPHVVIKDVLQEHAHRADALVLVSANAVKFLRWYWKHVFHQRYVQVNGQFGKAIVLQLDPLALKEV